MQTLRRFSRVLKRSTATLTSTRSFSAGLVQHRHTEYNNLDTKFEFNEESKKEIERVLKKFPPQYKASATIPLLYIAQEQEGSNNWVTLAAMNKIAELLEVPPMNVYEVATFYTMFNREPVGKYHIQLCGTTPCMVAGCGKDAIKQVIIDELGIKDGETTKDGMFTLDEVECLGACVNAPMIQVNNKEFYEHLTEDSMRALLETWKSGGTPKEGNQNHVKTCEGPMGQTSLKGGEPGFPEFLDLDKIIAEKKEADAKKTAEQA
mmetsp:Transcript_15217/g.21365  ORF Transcript_15217/g.21365 Transcript_15217/m.21365 type:complete len:263 (+) Transcript_15217:110-898(+)|eukprot:CAMPEP_0184486814 /NCGR_PEP_ID=MMETSP0113_2-20130426/8715_1 /TAXON_ID=91329 /ORGANISM="Norrisiella sphaerica, Strain BC52" /LENGTH=262 /DNA_ID=CAMNT_0026868869 /DNA_START=78 /DNA_END=866 /DNA_ORIENTATION=+